MKITYDKEADAIYIDLTSPEKRKKLKYKESRGDWPVHVDFSEDEKLLGVEILQASQMVDVDYLKKLKFERIDKKKQNK